MDLSNKFEFTAIDEAHVIKNATTASHTMVRWLKSPFTILVTASVLPNRVNDFKGYMEFIQADPALWNEDQLHEWGVKRCKFIRPS